MKRFNRRDYWKFGCGLAGLVLLCLNTGAGQSTENLQAQTRYTVIDLGTLGGSFSLGSGINNEGQAVGGANVTGDTATHAFLWNHGVMNDLRTLGGPNSFAEAASEGTGVAGISDTANADPLGGDACGFGTNLICRAFLWRNGGMIDLGTLGGHNSAAFGSAAINSRDQVVGWAELSTMDPNNPSFLQFHAFLWEKGVMNDLGTLGGPNSNALGIDEIGRVVGVSLTDSSLVHAFLWQNGVMNDLGTLGGTFSLAQEINHLGQVAGFSTLSGDTNVHAFLWQEGLMTDLGSLDADPDSLAFAINNKGQVVGQSGDRAFIWQRGVMTDLNTLIPAGSDLFLVAPFEINSVGRIVGVAVQNSTGQSHAFLATPTKEGSFGIGPRGESPKIALPENLRKLIRQRSGLSRFGAGPTGPQ